MNTWNHFGENVEGYDIPVLNEREIRASAGILFVFMFLSLMLAIFRQNVLLIKYVITFFLTDFIIRLFASPKYSPTLIIGRLIVGRQRPEYVGAAQKRFAWVIGLVLAVIMFIHLVILNATSPIAGLICLICLIFLFFESAFGICLGCLIYGWLFRGKAQYCPGEVCSAKSREEIQNTSKVQILIMVGFIVYIALMVSLFKDRFSQTPHAIFRSASSSLRK